MLWSDWSDWWDWLLVRQPTVQFFLASLYMCTGDDSISIRWASVAWMKWHDGERWWDLMGTYGTMGIDGGHGSEEMDFHPRTCPKSWRGGNCKILQTDSQNFTNFWRDWMRLAIFPRTQQRDLMKSHEIPYFFHAPDMAACPACRAGWNLDFVDFVDFQVIEALTAEPPVAWCQASGGEASGGVSPTRSRNSRHLRFFVFSRIREKLNNSEQFWRILDTCKEAQEFYGRSIIATFCFILAASWLFFFKAQGFCTQGQGGGLWGTRWVSSSASSTSEYASRRLLPWLDSTTRLKAMAVSCGARRTFLVRVSARRLLGIFRRLDFRRL